MPEVAKVVEARGAIMARDAEEVWEAYYQTLKKRRLSEVPVIWAEMVSAGVTPETVLALDFSHFSSDRKNAESLATQLSEHYQVEVSADPQGGYWSVWGTTRPYGITLIKEQHASWVEFMADVARSHSCVFASWTLEAPRLGKVFSSDVVDVDDQ